MEENDNMPSFPSSRLITSYERIASCTGTQFRSRVSSRMIYHARNSWKPSHIKCLYMGDTSVTKLRKLHVFASVCSCALHSRTWYIILLIRNSGFGEWGSYISLYMQCNILHSLFRICQRIFTTYNHIIVWYKVIKIYSKTYHIEMINW